MRRKYKASLTVRTYPFAPLRAHNGFPFLTTIMTSLFFGLLSLLPAYLVYVPINSKVLAASFGPN